MIIATHTAKNYSPGQVVSRYVRIDGNGVFRFCEVGEDRWYDLRQGTVDREDLPADVIKAAEANRGKFPSYTAWPITG